MPILKSAVHERFAQLVAEGMRAKEAYVAIGRTGSAQAASNLRRRPDVSARIGELLAQKCRIAERASEKALERAAEKQALSKEYVLTTLMEVVERSMQRVPVKGADGEWRFDAQAATKALQLLGSHLGLFIDRKEVGKPGEFANLDAEEMRQAITERLSALASKVAH
jgi:phage terminase small subunit